MDLPRFSTVFKEPTSFAFAEQGWQLAPRAAQSNISVLAFFCPLNRQGCKRGRVQQGVTKSDYRFDGWMLYR